MPYKDYQKQLEYNRKYARENKLHLNRNRERYNQYMKGYRAATKYGLTLEEYEAIISRGCEICGTKEGKLCLDHNHETLVNRGCLCSKCNLTLGQIGDSVEWLESAISYLKRHKT